MHNQYSVAMSDQVNDVLLQHLLRNDWQEDVAFAVWIPSNGSDRITALIQNPILPRDGDRQVHGNASFNQQYFERACKQAMENGGGVAFFHSHLGPGWQGMSEDDELAEKRIAGAALGLTDLPLVGLTAGTDGTWSARFWTHLKAKEYKRNWCSSVRVVGKQLKVSFADHVDPKPKFKEMFKRTVTVWGPDNHANFTRLRIGVVGLGSVGSIVAETLARMGMKRVSLIDFDEVQEHNLDRLLGATEDDVGHLKIDVIGKVIARSATADGFEIETVPYSLAEKEGYEAALDCDVLFSCVDRPRPRRILNHFAYAHLIPVIDGGIAVRFKKGNFTGVDWQLQTAGPNRACLQCIGSYEPGDVATEMEGKLDDPSYLLGLEDTHRFKRNENVFPFSANLASLEILQFVALVTGIGGITDFGIQRFRYNPGIIDCDVLRSCKPECDFKNSIARGDRDFYLYGKDLGAEQARKRQKEKIYE